MYQHTKYIYIHKCIQVFIKSTGYIEQKHLYIDIMIISRYDFKMLI